MQFIFSNEIYITANRVKKRAQPIIKHSNKYGYFGKNEIIKIKNIINIDNKEWIQTVNNYYILSKYTSYSSLKIAWQKNLKNAKKIATQENKKIIILMSKGNSFASNKIEKEILQNTHIAKILKQNYILVKLNTQSDKFPEFLNPVVVPTIFIYSSDLHKRLYRFEGLIDKIEFYETITN